VTDYIARVHDLNGMLQLLKLQLEISQNDSRSAAQVVANSKYINPYTLEPMSYDEKDHRIYFECLDKTSTCELNL